MELHLIIPLSFRIMEDIGVTTKLYIYIYIETILNILNYSEKREMYMRGKNSPNLFQPVPKAKSISFKVGLYLNDVKLNSFSNFSLAIASLLLIALHSTLAKP